MGASDTAVRRTVDILIGLLALGLFMFTLAEIPILGYLVAAERTQQRVETVNEWLGSHGREIAMALCGMAGAVLIARGLVATL